MPQDHTASTIAQARVIRDGLDPARVETPVRTATLALLLDTQIDLGSQPGTEKIREAQRAAIAASTMTIARTREAFQKVLDAERAAAEARNA
jgi:hypothetical protein